MQIKVIDSKKTAKVADAQYGTFLTGVSSNPDSIYIKVKKRGMGAGLDLTFPKNNCVLFNVKYGTMRAVAGDERCIPLDGSLELWPDDTQSWRK